MKLPPRLAKIAELVPSGKVVADIGTDHALLPLYLLEQGISDSVIAVEVGDKPFARAQKNLEGHPLGTRVDLRLGEGLQALQPQDGVEVAVIAGLGSGTIREILQQKPPNLDKLDTFILQPMTRPDDLRAWLPGKGFAIAHEALAKDDGRLYEIFLAVCQDGSVTKNLPFGEKLLENEDPLLKEYLDLKLGKTRLILESLSRSRRKDRDELRLKFAKELKKLERLMDIVSKGK